MDNEQMQTITRYFEIVIVLAFLVGTINRIIIYSRNQKPEKIYPPLNCRSVKPKIRTVRDKIEAKKLSRKKHNNRKINKIKTNENLQNPETKNIRPS